MNFDDLKEQWQALEDWKKLLITVGFSLAIVYLIYIYNIEPVMNEKGQLTKEVEKLKSDISFLKKRATPEKIIKIENQIKEIKNQIKVKETELNTLKTIIPDKAEINKILKFTASNVYKSNLILNKFQVSKEETVYVSYNEIEKTLSIRAPKKRKKIKPKGTHEIELKRITVNLSLTGSPKNLIKYVSYLSKSKRLLIIDDISLKSQHKGLKINMNISTFYSQEKQK